MKKINVTEIGKLVISVIVCQMAGVIGSAFTAPSIPTWYATLKKPPFTPPNWLFAPVWISLFFLMGISAFLVWRKGLGSRQVRIALTIFVVQLIFNILWSVVFFGFQSPLGGLIVISVLWVAILLTILKFLKVSRPAGFLLLPYISWVSLAALLNASIFLVNL
ncbi:MAG: TspO/MBR family protein [Candidatus Aerophobetes bacterium]|nr:TspO/MBR family protein [Candidatus Aerophobetes bacterium]